MIDCAPLHPPAAATAVRLRNGETLLTDGPAAEIKEQRCSTTSCSATSRRRWSRQTGPSLSRCRRARTPGSSSSTRWPRIHGSSAGRSSTSPAASCFAASTGAPTRRRLSAGARARAADAGAGVHPSPARRGDGGRPLTIVSERPTRSSLLVMSSPPRASAQPWRRRSSSSRSRSSPPSSTSLPRRTITLRSTNGYPIRAIAEKMNHCTA